MNLLNVLFTIALALFLDWVLDGLSITEWSKRRVANDIVLVGVMLLCSSGTALGNFVFCALIIVFMVLVTALKIMTGKSLFAYLGGKADK